MPNNHWILKECMYIMFACTSKGKSNHTVALKHKSNNECRLGGEKDSIAPHYTNHVRTNEPGRPKCDSGVNNY